MNDKKKRKLNKLVVKLSKTVYYILPDGTYLAGQLENLHTNLNDGEIYGSIGFANGVEVVQNIEDIKVII